MKHSAQGLRRYWRVFRDDDPILRLSKNLWQNTLTARRLSSGQVSAQGSWAPHGATDSYRWAAFLCEEDSPQDIAERAKQEEKWTRTGVPVATREPPYRVVAMIDKWRTTFMQAVHEGLHYNKPAMEITVLFPATGEPRRRLRLTGPLADPLSELSDCLALSTSTTWAFPAKPPKRKPRLLRRDRNYPAAY